MVLDFSDDIWFLRACLLTSGSVISKVHWRIGSRIIQRLVGIKLAGRIDGRLLELIEVGCLTKNSAIVKRADLETWNNLKEWLETVISSGQAGQKSGYHLPESGNQIYSRAVWLHAIITKIIDFD